MKRMILLVLCILSSACADKVVSQDAAATESEPMISVSFRDLTSLGATIVVETRKEGKCSLVGGFNDWYTDIFATFPCGPWKANLGEYNLKAYNNKYNLLVIYSSPDGQVVESEPLRLTLPDSTISIEQIPTSLPGEIEFSWSSYRGDVVVAQCYQAGFDRPTGVHETFFDAQSGTVKFSNLTPGAYYFCYALLQFREPTNPTWILDSSPRLLIKVP